MVPPSLPLGKNRNDLIRSTTGSLRQLDTGNGTISQRKRQTIQLAEYLELRQDSMDE